MWDSSKWTIQDFFNIYNIIDNHFTSLLADDKSILSSQKIIDEWYITKLIIIKNWKFAISWYINKNFNILYESWIIAQLLSKKENSSVTPSIRFINSLSKIKKNILYPYTMNFFCKNTEVLKYTTWMDVCLQIIEKQELIPVTNIDNVLQWIITYRNICSRLQKKIPNKINVIRELRTFPLQNFFSEQNTDSYNFVHQSELLIDIINQAKYDQRSNILILNTQNKQNIKSDNIVWYVTKSDLPNMFVYYF